MSHFAYTDESTGTDEANSLIPLIDFLFILIIFFLTSDPRIEGAIDLPLPPVPDPSAAAASATQLEVDLAGSLTVDGVACELDQLPTALERAAKPSALLRIAKDATVEDLAKVNDICNRANVKLALAVRKAD